MSDTKNNLKYYQELISEFPICVKRIEGKGKGVIALEAVEADDELLQDTPIVSSQFEWNKDYFQACAYCMKSLESPHAMAKRLSNISTLEALPFADVYEMPEPIGCEDASLCKAKFCSPECQENGWLMLQYIYRDAEKAKKYEELCKAWKAIHYPPETTTITLVALMICRILCLLDQGFSKEEAMEDFTQLTSCGSTKDATTGNISSAKFLRAEGKAKLDKLRVMMKDILYDERIKELFEEEGFYMLLSIVALNGLGIGTSAFDEYMQNLYDLEESEEVDAALATAGAVAEAMVEHSGQYTVCDGSGLFPLASMMNHDCDPNATVTYPFNDHTLTVMATRDIEVQRVNT